MFMLAILRWVMRCRVLDADCCVGCRLLCGNVTTHGSLLRDCWCVQDEADKSLAAIPVILLTSLNDVEERVKGFELGAVGGHQPPPPGVLSRSACVQALQLSLTPPPPVSV